jgi:VWFA-related protein
MATPIPCRRPWPLLTLFLLGAGIAPAAVGDPPEFTYRTNAAEVRLTFSVSDQDHHGVATLQPSDFAVVDKDIIVRDFQSFTRSDSTKLEIAVLFDASESVTPRFHQEIADVLSLITETAGIPDENLSMFSFQGLQPALLCAGNCRALRAAEQLPTGRAGGLTPLYDAIVFATQFLSQRGDAHAEKVLIVFSDGMDTISRNSPRDAVDDSLRNDVQLDCIDLNQRSAASEGRAVLRSLANATGGRYFPPPEGGIRALHAILEDFRTSYSVSYRLPSRAAGFHAVRILPTRNLNLQFRSRSGYYYPNQVH